MKRYFLNALALVACIAFLDNHAIAQQNSGKLADNDEIIIRQKGDKNTKVTVEINNGDVKINGKPLSEFNDDNVVIRKRGTDGTARLYATPRSPFQGSTWNFNDNESTTRNLRSSSNKGFLGVTSEKDENGARITNVTKGSAADKAGLKEGDLITRVHDSNITNPEELAKAIGKFKPEEKTVITYRRDKKEQKANVILSKRPGATTYFPENFEYNKEFNFDFNSPGADGLNLMLRSNGPKLGIKAQDTEEGKGVKVLDVDDDSNADKAGIKEGDILTDFDGRAVNSATELMEAARDAKDKNSIKVKLTRNGKSQEVEVKIPKKLKTANL